MKKLNTLLMVLLICIIAIPVHVLGQAPEKLSYQAIIRDEKGNIVTGSRVNIQISILQGLEDGAVVYIETHEANTNAVTKSYVDALRDLVADLQERLFLLEVDNGTGTISDIEGNIYRVVKIGDQYWMAENLRTGTYYDGKPIGISPVANWPDQILGLSAWYNNDSASYQIPYGRLYNWYAVNTGKLCPAGWHVPGDQDWKEMELFLGMDALEVESTGNRGTNEGGKLKSEGTLYWASPNTAANNETGFSALPGGSIQGTAFNNMGNYGYWWTSDSVTNAQAMMRYLGHDLGSVFRDGFFKSSGFSVRCIRDK